MLTFLRRLFGRQRKGAKRPTGNVRVKSVTHQDDKRAPEHREKDRPDGKQDGAASQKATTKSGEGGQGRTDRYIPTEPPTEETKQPQVIHLPQDTGSQTVIYAPQSSARRSDENASKGRRQQTTIDIGVDFGTSCSKVVIRAPFIGGGIAWAVPIGHQGRSDIGRYLRETPRTAGHESLKVALMSKSAMNDNTRAAAAFIATLIKDSQDWFARTEPDLSQTFRIEWRVALGCASQTSGGEVIERFLRMVRIAARDAGLNEENAIVVPEVAASAIGYANSSQRPSSPTLHVLMDVGASTLDICGFMLTTREGDDRYNILQPTVKQLGAFVLHQERLKQLTEDQRSERFRMPGLSDLLTEIPSELSDYCHGPVPGALEKANQNFEDRCIKQLMECIHALRTRRAPNEDVWNDGLPLLVTGGASNMDFYNRVHKTASVRMRKMGTRGLRVRPLPMPYRLRNQGLPSEIFLRLGTAHGLSYFDRSGHVAWDNEFPDMPRYEYRAKKEFIDKDYV